MTDPAPSAPSAPNWISPRAEALVERFFAEGVIVFRTSMKSASVIIGCIVLFLLLALSPLWISPPATRGSGLAAALGTLGLPIIGGIIWVLVILFPRDRVRIDVDGITVRRQPTIRWEWMLDMGVWISKSRGAYRYLAIRVRDDAPVGTVQPRGARIATLPYMLDPVAGVQREACTETARRLRTGERPRTESARA